MRSGQDTSGVASRLTRLGLVLDQIIYEHEGRYSTDEAFFRFIELVAARTFDRIQFCSRVKSSDRHGPYMLDPAVHDILPLPWYRNMGDLYVRSPLLFPRIIDVFDEAMRTWDMVILGGINPLAPLAIRMAHRRDLPAVLWVRGSYFGVLNHRLGKAGLRRLAGMAVARLVLESIPTGTHVVSSGTADHDFLSRMGPVQVVYTSKFGRDDFVTLPRPRRPEGRRPRLLYVGRIAPEKGLEILLDAMIRLHRSSASHSPVLSLVGADFLGSRYGMEFEQRLRASEVADDVEMTGYVPYGDRLLQIYDAHDVFVLPSHTEGFPQVLLEAMARGLPVVSTEVGGVSTVVRNEQNGLLVPPGDGASLAAAVDRLLSDRQLAERLAIEGQRAARRYSRETQVEIVVDFMRRCFPKLARAATPS